MSKLKYILSLTLILQFVSVKAQTLNQNFRHLTIEDGLSHNNVYAIIQDNTGFIWIGTQNGLNKYDGYEFSQYYYSSEDSCSLISSNFGKLLQDSKGRIWIGTYRGGISLYYPDENRAVRFINNPDDETSIASNLIRGIIEDKNGNVWIGTGDNGLCMYNDKNDKFIRYTNDENNPNSLINNSIKSISYDIYGNIWVATTSGLSKFNPEESVFTNYRYEGGNSNTTLNDNILQCVFSDSKGRTWVGTKRNGINRYNPKTETFDFFEDSPISSARIQCVYEDSYGRIWIGTYTKGVFLYNENDNSFINFRNSENNPNSLSNNKIETIIEDKAGNLWIGTRGGGINILDLKPEKFTNLINDKTNKNSLPNGSVKCITSENDNIIWFGTTGGLCKYDKINNTYLTFVEDKNSNNAISNSRIRALAYDKNNKTIWAGTYNGGLNKIDYVDNHYVFTHFKRDYESENTLVSNQINALLIDDEQAVWIGTSGGLNRLTFNEAGEPIFETFKAIEDDSHSISNRYITDIFKDSKGNIWIATSNGLNLFNPESNNFTQYWNNATQSEDAEANAINTITEAEDGKLWLGSDGSGFFLFDPATGNFEKFFDNTFKTNDISAIIKDNANNLWISTAMGISKYNITDKHFTYYGISDGLNETGFNRNSAIQTNTGEIYFGNISGVTIIQPDKIELNNNIPKIVLTEFKKFNQSYFSNLNSFCTLTPENLDEINLSYKDYVFSFEFASLDFTDPSKNLYRYKMEGFNDEWIDFETKRYATFTNLPPGKYTLKVQGSNNDGIWSDDENSLQISINVKPPFWQTWWFYTLVGIFIISVIYFYIKIREAKLKREKLILEQKVKQRTEEVEAQKEEILQQANALEESNIELEKLSIVASETDNSVTIISPTGEFEWINKGFIRLYGWDNLESFKKARGNNVFDGKFNNITKKTLEECIKEKKTVVSNDKVKGAEDKEIWLRTTWTPILDDQNNITKIIAIDSDITDIKKAEQEIIEKSEKINLQNENIKSSIRYALTIQKAILPPASVFKQFPDHFILFKPKDIVSGDFYWYYQTEDYHFVSVSDCTGHGVPGAFMSVIGTRLLDGIVIERKIYDVATILTKLNEEIISSLNQLESENRDGMDLGIIRIKKTDKKEKEIVYEGSKRELIYHTKNDNKIRRLKGSIKRVGGVLNSKYNAIFENKSLTLNEGDVVYLSTDGYIDQCNLDRKKIGTQRLISIIEEVKDYSLKDQKYILEQILSKWQGEASQRDDISIIGLKL